MELDRTGHRMPASGSLRLVYSRRVAFAGKADGERRGPGGRFANYVECHY
jgi:hypothetical protein